MHHCTLRSCVCVFLGVHCYCDDIDALNGRMSWDISNMRIFAFLRVPFWSVKAGAVSILSHNYQRSSIKGCVYNSCAVLYFSDAQRVS